LYALSFYGFKNFYTIKLNQLFYPELSSSDTILL
jgi:hypothetical protein